MQLRPAIDLIDGKCVRLEKGDFNKISVYAKDPVDQAKLFEDLGCRFLHLVDLDAARKGYFQQFKIVEKIACATNLHIDVGGGMYTTEDAKKAFDHGARQITAGSIAVKNIELVKSWLNEFGNEAIILGMDVENEHVLTRGWQEKSNYHWRDFLMEYLDTGILYCISTDVSKDGMLDGPAYDLYENIKNINNDLKVIASGGVSNISEVYRLKEAGIDGVVIGKAIYEGKIMPHTLTQFILENPQSL